MTEKRRKKGRGRKRGTRTPGSEARQLPAKHGDSRMIKYTERMKEKRPEAKCK